MAKCKHDLHDWQNTASPEYVKCSKCGEVSKVSVPVARQPDRPIQHEPGTFPGGGRATTLSPDQLTHLATALDDLLCGVVTTLENEPVVNEVYVSKHAIHLEDIAVDIQQVGLKVLRLRDELSRERSLTNGNNQ